MAVVTGEDQGYGEQQSYFLVHEPSWGDVAPNVY
jgi:hypothetical protein